MRRLRRRIALSIVGGILLLAAYTLVYQWTMATFEGEQLTYVRALQVVLEALTTAGFGGDAPWSSTAANAVVIGMNLTGVLLVFFTIPYFAIPILESVFQTEAPTETSLSDHVIVCADSPREMALQRELDDADIPSVYIKHDEQRVRELVDEGVDAIYGDPEASGTLERANIGDARALLADINDEVNASIILAARRLAPELQVVSVVEDADAETYHRYAGADDVVRPRVVVGERLAAKTRQTELHDAFDDVTWSGEPPALTEVLVESGSELAGQTLAECRFSQRFGLTVLGGWFHGEFVAPVDPDRTITDNAVLLVVGEPSEFRTLGDMSALRSCEHAVVAGYGVVGQRVAERLSESGVEVTVLDSEPKDGVDIVGDITDPETLDALDLAGVDSVVLTLSRDSLAVYAALVVENRAPAVDTLARADDADNVQRYYDAGIEYALSVSEVTAHMLEGCLSEEGSDTDDATGWAVVRVRAPQLAGDRLGDIDVRVRTDVHVVAIEREGQTHSNPGGSFELRDDDVLVLAGDETAVTEFERAHQSDRTGAE